MTGDPADDRRRPRAVRLGTADAPGAARSDAGPAEGEQARMSVAFLADPFEAPEAAIPSEEQAVERAQRRGIFRRSLVSWAGLFWSALGGLVSLGIGLWVTRLIDDAFARSATLGVVGLVLAGLAVLALIAMVGREAWAIGRQRHIARLHAALARAHAANDAVGARRQLAELVAVYASRPGTARARNDLAALHHEIIDGRDLIEIAERGLVAPLDAEAKAAIARAAKRVSVLTTVAPRAIIDIVIVLLQAVRLIRQIAEIYGGRPGLLGFLQLARSVAAHLAITGSMAAGDTLLQQIVGHGIAAKVSTRLGEGVLNGILTARIGLSAIAVCRPVPFLAIKAPTARSVVPFLFRTGREGDEPSEAAARAISSSSR